MYIYIVYNKYACMNASMNNGKQWCVALYKILGAKSFRV